MAKTKKSALERLYSLKTLKRSVEIVVCDLEMKALGLRSRASSIKAIAQSLRATYQIEGGKSHAKSRKGGSGE